MYYILYICVCVWFQPLIRCLEAIIEDPGAHPIFHEIHTLDSGRLRHGYERYMENPKKFIKISILKQKWLNISYK